MTHPPREAGAAGEREAGAAAERTRLAWRRTTLALTAVALLTIRLATRDHLDPLTTVAAALAMLSWVVLIAMIQPRVQGLSARPAGGPGRLLPVVVLGCLGYTVLGLILVLAP